MTLLLLAGVPLVDAFVVGSLFDVLIGLMLCEAEDWRL